MLKLLYAHIQPSGDHRLLRQAVSTKPYFSHVYTSLQSKRFLPWGLQGAAESLLRDGQQALEGAAQAAQQQLAAAQQQVRQGMAGATQSAREATDQAVNMGEQAGRTGQWAASSSHGNFKQLL